MAISSLTGKWSVKLLLGHSKSWVALPATRDRGQSMIPIMNALSFDAMTTHWEFAYGPAGVREIGKRLNYPMLAINCYHKESGDLFCTPYLMINRDGSKR